MSRLNRRWHEGRPPSEQYRVVRIVDGKEVVLAVSGTRRLATALVLYFMRSRIDAGAVYRVAA